MPAPGVRERKARQGKGKVPGERRAEAWTSRISNDKLAAKLGLCQHVLPKSDRNDGLARLPFISGKFSLHPVYYELAGICLIVFASAATLAEIKARLLLHTEHCASRPGGGERFYLAAPGQGGRVRRMAPRYTKQGLQKP